MIKLLKTCGFYKIENGREYYRYTHANNSEKFCVYTQGKDFATNYDWGNLHPIPIPNALKECFAKARQQFAELLRSILDGSGGFYFAKGGHYLIAYRKEVKKHCNREKCFIERRDRHNLYRFVVFWGNGNVEQHICTVEEFLYRANRLFQLDNKLPGSEVVARACRQIRDNAFPLYNSAKENDRYLHLSLKFLAGLASQQEADEATAVDGLVRFVPQDKVYDDVEILEMRQRPIHFFQRLECYFCAVSIDGRKWRAQWYPTGNTLCIAQDFSRYTPSNIQVSDKILAQLLNKAVKIYPTAR